MKVKKILAAAVGASMLCASLPFSTTTVDFVKDNIITAKAAEEYYYADTTNDFYDYEATTYSYEDSGTWETATTSVYNDDVYTNTTAAEPATEPTEDTTDSYISDEIVIPKDVEYSNYSGSGMRIEVGKVEISKKDAGKIIAVPVSVFNNKGFAGTGIEYGFDQDIKSVGVRGNIIGSPVEKTGKGYMAVTSATSENITKDGLLYYLLFKLPEKVSIDDSFNIFANINTLSDADSNDVEVAAIRGSITVTSKASDYYSDEIVMPKAVTYDHSNDSGTSIEVGKVQVTKDDIGKVIAVPVSIFNNPGFAGTGLQYGFDKSINPVGVRGNLIGSPVRSVSDGVMALTSAGSEDMTNDGVLYYLLFELPDEAIVGDTFNIFASITQLANADTKDVKAKSYRGSITVVDKIDIPEESEEITPKNVTYLHSNDNKTVIEVGNVEISKKDAGKTILVPVSIFNNPGFAGTGIKYTCDTDAKTVGIDGKLISSPVKCIADGFIAVTSARSTDITRDGVLYYLKYRLPENATVGYRLNISAELKQFVDAAGNDVEVKLYGGSITVVDSNDDSNISNEIVRPENVTYKHSNDNETVIEVGKAEVSKDDIGKIIEIPVSIFNNIGFAGTAIRYRFDERIESLGTEGNILNPEYAVDDGIMAATSASEYNKTEDGVLYYLKLRLPETASVGDTFKITAALFIFADEKGDYVEESMYGGSITIVDSKKVEPTTETIEETTDDTLVYGDANSDGNITIADAVLLNKYLVDSAILTDVQLRSADCLFDEEVNAADTLAMLSYIVGTYTSLPIYPNK